MTNRYYITQGVRIGSQLKYYAIRDSMIGASADDDRIVSTHDDKEMAHKICRLANSAYRDEVNARILINGGIFI